MSKRKSMPVALTVAGSDSGGGAGIQADLKVFAALGVHGTTAITCLTAQNPKAVTGVEGCPPEFIVRQIEAVCSELPPAAIKTGMLYSARIVRRLVTCFKTMRPKNLVVDPVMVSTSGARLLEPAAVKILVRELLPMATLITPNLDEVEVLLGDKPGNLEGMRDAARKLHDQFGCPVLVKGGHLRAAREAADIFFDGHDELLLTAPFVRGINTHGTGCTYSAAISGYLALGLDLPNAVCQAKEFISEAIEASRAIGRHTVLNPLAALESRGGRSRGKSGGLNIETACSKHPGSACGCA